MTLITTKLEVFLENMKNERVMALTDPEVKLAKSWMNDDAGTDLINFIDVREGLTREMIEGIQQAIELCEEFDQLQVKADSYDTIEESMHIFKMMMK